jgi:glycosyltransferase involved in cell wall biosynthesis
VRIGVDARIADYTVGGIARYTVQLLRAMRQVDVGDATLVAARARKPKVDRPEIPTHETITVRTPPHHWLERHALPFELRGANLQMLHSPDFVAPGGPWRKVITVHDLAFLRMPHLVTDASRRYYGGVRRAVQEADAIIAVSQATARDLVDLAGAPIEKVRVVYEAAESSLRPMRREDAVAAVRERHGVDGPYILFVGTIEPRKNLTRLLQAFSLLRREFPSRLVVAGGRGWLSEDVFSTANRLSLADGVVFLGDVAPSDLRALYCASEVLAMPSLYEGFGLPVLEAMACGTPVVASDAGSLSEVVGDAGVLVQPDDPNDIAHGLGWVLGNTAFRDAIIRRGLARAAAFSWERAARETLDIYRSVLDR